MPSSATGSNKLRFIGGSGIMKELQCYTNWIVVEELYSQGSSMTEDQQGLYLQEKYYHADPNFTSFAQPAVS